MKYFTGGKQIMTGYEAAKEKYAALGVDTEAAMET